MLKIGTTFVCVWACLPPISRHSTTGYATSNVSNYPCLQFSHVKTPRDDQNPSLPLLQLHSKVSARSRIGCVRTSISYVNSNASWGRKAHRWNSTMSKTARRIPQHLKKSQSAFDPFPSNGKNRMNRYYTITTTKILTKIYKTDFCSLIKTQLCRRQRRRRNR